MRKRKKKCFLVGVNGCYLLNVKFIRKLFGNLYNFQTKRKKKKKKKDLQLSSGKQYKILLTQYKMKLQKDVQVHETKREAQNTCKLDSP